MSLEVEKTAKLEYIDFAPPADVIETNGDIKILLDVPGTAPEHLDIDIEECELKIKATTEIVRCNKLVRYKRSFQISDQIAKNKINATVSDGVLTINLPKAEHAKVHKIKVQTS